MAKYASIHGKKKIQPGNEQIKYQQVNKKSELIKKKIMDLWLLSKISVQLSTKNALTNLYD